MVPEVFYSVCYNSKDVPPAIAKLHSFHAAILHDYCRHRVQHADYPGITEEPNHEVFGTFTTGLTEANLSKLDFFEGDQYERRKVQVRLLTKVGDAKGVGNVEGEGRTAEVYVFLNKNELEKREWDLEEFRRDKLQKWTRAGYVFEGECIPMTHERIFCGHQVNQRLIKY